MKDKNPLKSLYALRDIITGLIQPWHSGQDQLHAVENLKLKLNLIINECASDDVFDVNVVSSIFADTISMISLWSREITNLKSLRDRLDRVEMILRSMKKNVVDVM